MADYTPPTFWQYTKQHPRLPVITVMMVVFSIVMVVDTAQTRIERKEAISRKIARCEALPNGVAVTIDRKVYCLDRTLTPLHAGFHSVR